MVKNPYFLNFQPLFFKFSIESSNLVFEINLSLIN